MTTVMTDEALCFVPSAQLHRAAGGLGGVAVVVGMTDEPEPSRGLRMLAQRHPTVRFAVTSGEHVLMTRYLHGLTNLTLLPALEPEALAWLLDRADLVLAVGDAPVDADVPVVRLPADRHELIAVATDAVEGVTELSVT